MAKHPWTDNGAVASSHPPARTDPSPPLPRQLPPIHRGVVACLAILLFGVLPVAGQAPGQPGDELEFSVLTFGPGDEIWEPFGHIGLRLRNLRTGADHVFNWGVFSFEQEGFLGRFLRGEMLYSMGADPTAGTLRLYERLNRTIDEQQLDLTASEKTELWQLLAANLREPDYRYDYFLDNCSTRVRDLLDQATGGLVRPALESRPDATYRFHTRRLTQQVSAVFSGMDVLMAGRTDRPQSAWEASFAPLILSEELDRVVLDRPGQPPRPLVAGRARLFEADRSPLPEEPDFLVWRDVVPGWLCGLVVLWGSRAASRWRRGAAAVAAGLWSLLTGLAGALLVFMSFTAHVFAHWNENLLQLSPLSVIAAPLAAWSLARGTSGPVLRGLLGLVLLLSVSGMLLQLVPGIDQVNGWVVLAALPTHFALWWSVRDAGTPPETSVSAT